MPQNCPFPGGTRRPANISFPGATRVYSTSQMTFLLLQLFQHSSWSCLTNRHADRHTQTERQTHRDSQTDTQRDISQNISNNRLHFCIFALCELNPVVSLSSAKNKKKVHCVAPTKKAKCTDATASTYSTDFDNFWQNYCRESKPLTGISPNECRFTFVKTQTLKTATCQLNAASCFTKKTHTTDENTPRSQQNHSQN